MQPCTRRREHRLLILAALSAAVAMPAVHARTSQTVSAEQAISSEATPPARDSSAPAPMSFEELDANGDGAVSKDEAAVDPALAQAFGTLDKDADGRLSPVEYAAYNATSGS
jgi:hypothetical protein